MKKLQKKLRTILNSTLKFLSKVSKTRKTCILSLFLVAIFIFSACAPSYYYSDDYDPTANPRFTFEEAVAQKDVLLTKIEYRKKNPQQLRLDISDTDVENTRDLPNISIYPITVQGKAPLNVEIACSTEKAGDGLNDIYGNDGWLNVMAERYNKARADAAITIRQIVAGEGQQQIVYGGYRPDAYAPSHDKWGEMISESGVPMKQLAARLVGNTAGILMAPEIYKSFTEKHGDVTLKKVIDASLAGEIIFAYTYPYASDTGLNILLNILYSFDPKNPLSEIASNMLREFQKTAPPTANSTSFMREKARQGIVDCMAMEYQAYINTPELKNYIFIPCGIRHDNPLWVPTDISPEKEAVLKDFVEFCLSEESQAEATKRGFNAHDDYQGSGLEMNGAEVIAAQKIWKENKDGGRPVIAVFVVDISPSMDNRGVGTEGSRLKELQASLLGALDEISETNYIGLITYDHLVDKVVPIDLYTPTQKAYLRGAIRDLSTQNGSTASYDGAMVALDMVLEKLKEIPDAKAMIFLLSDGDSNSGLTLNEVQDTIVGVGIPFHPIAYAGENPQLEALAKTHREGAYTVATPENVKMVIRNLLNLKM